MIPLIKRHGQSEEYDEKKVYASVYAAALIAGYKETESEMMAKKVNDALNRWIKAKEGKREIIHSTEIRDYILMNIEDKDVAVIYKHHLDVC